MVWKHENKLIFIHIPKCGGTSIEAALDTQYELNGYGLENKKAIQHYEWKDYKNKLGSNIFNNYYKFSICRHPYTKVISDYFWLKYTVHFQYDNFQEKTFDQYLNYCEYIVKNKLYNLTNVHDHFKPQYTYTFNENNKLMVNELFRFEAFNYIKEFMKNKFNVNVNHLNKKVINKEIKLTLSQKNKIYEIYKKDFTLLEYKR